MASVTVKGRCPGCGKEGVTLIPQSYRSVTHWLCQECQEGGERGKDRADGRGA